MTMMYHMPTSEFNLNRAIESIKLAQQEQKRELEKKDETLASLHKKIESLQMQRERECAEFKRLNDKENRELLSENQALRHELTIERAENDRLKDEISRLRYDLTIQVNRVAEVESDHEKAKHIISVLYSKLKGLTNTQSLPQISINAHTRTSLSK